MPMESRVYSNIGGREIAAFAKEAAAVFAGGDFGMDDVLELRKLGIGFCGDVADMSREMMSGLKKVGMGMDAYSTIQQPTLPMSLTTPVQFLQSWLPGFVKIQFAPQVIDEVIGIVTAGSWEDEEIVQPVMETVGTAVPYGDTTNVPLSNYNIGFNIANVVRFESGFRVGKLEEARAARVRVNSGDAKREACSISLDIQRNNIGFLGYNAGANNTYGFLNAPSVLPYQQVATGVGGYGWPVKTFLEIVADIRAAIVQVRTQSSGLIDPKKVAMTLFLPTNRVDYLSVTSSFGNSVQEWLDENYPLIRVVSAVQLDNANSGSNVFYLFADTVPGTSTDDGKSFIQVVPAKFMVLGVQPMAKGYEEDFTNATAGVLAKRPFAITRWYGI